MNEYCMFKGRLLRGAPFFRKYAGNPHYIITVVGSDKNEFNIVVNSASTEPGAAGSKDVYFYVDLHFADPVVDKLKELEPGLYKGGFPRLDYWQDRSLLALNRMRPVPYQVDGDNEISVNSDISFALSINTSRDSQFLPYNNGKTTEDREFWDPEEPEVIVYGFGFLFLPAQDGLHETHMNQGNPKGPHYRENGTFQDGAVIVQRGNDFIGIFTAFQTQYVPTNSQGNPIPGAESLPDYIAQNG